MSLYYYKHQFVPSDRTLELYFTGCSLKCPNCQNEFLQERKDDNTREVSFKDILKELEDYKGITKQVHILGGEPLEQNLEELGLLLKGLKEDLELPNIIFFTGWDLPSSFIKSHKFLFQHCSFIKTGHYDENQKNRDKTLLPGMPFPLATTNQSFVKVDTTLFE